MRGLLEQPLDVRAPLAVRPEDEPAHACVVEDDLLDGANRVAEARRASRVDFAAEAWSLSTKKKLDNCVRHELNTGVLFCFFIIISFRLLVQRR